MRKLLCLLLVLLFVPLVSFADDRDPIVGCWYMYYDKSVTPEMESAFPGYDQLICIYIFNESGVVNVTGASVVGTVGTPEYTPAGKWSKDGDHYKISLIGYAENAISYCENDCILLNINDSNYYMKLKKLYNFNPYQDYVAK